MNLLRPVRHTLIHLLACSLLPGADAPRNSTSLILHVSARDQRTLRQQASLSPIQNGQAIDLLLDGANNKRIAKQPLAERRPLMVSGEEEAFLTFDGRDDFLTIDNERRLSPELTVLLLAAPAANPGMFTGMLACSELGKNDFSSGMNLDFGPQATAELSVLNVESGGASGFRDLYEPGFMQIKDRPFGDFHVFTVRSRIGREGIEVFVDGMKSGARDRLESLIALDQFVLGCRQYSNDPAAAPFAQGFYQGALAEMLVYDRALSDEEMQALENVLLPRRTALQALKSGSSGHVLEAVDSPPDVQMLVPGFTVEELPLRIGNLNNLRYRHDGKLVGLGYDGRIHLLTDTDQDGLEDRDALFWDQQTMRGPIGIALLPAGDPRGDGVFVSSKGKISLILDKDRDGRAEDEKIVASGWQEIAQNVDAVGLAVHPTDGSLYFGLGCTNFANAYQLDASGNAAYDLQSEHGTIQKVSADFSRRETVCTGVRFTCALAFNRLADLFATEQEGATWLPNGNPLDELLHIQPGKHYGFPPRHPRHLPSVVDEPAVSEYSPQHQSTVGMVFNEGVNGGQPFGPKFWEGDALVCGESRGKIWRTRLAKTPSGYVTHNHLIACLTMLTIDACVSPHGDLVVACHSGPPDWGTGPAGIGRIFKIRYTGKSLPQPVLAWAAAPDEFRIAFDRPLNPEEWRGVQAKLRVEAGRYVSAGDRFEIMRPGYQVVRDQMAEPRRWVELFGFSLSADHRTMSIRVPRQTEPVNYGITLPLPAGWKQPGGLAQHPQMDLLATLNGCVAGNSTHSCVMPHPSLAASAILTEGSSEHRAILDIAGQDGNSQASGRINLSNPFVPATQSGSTIDWDQSTDAFASKLATLIAEPSGAVIDGSAAADPRWVDVSWNFSAANPNFTGFHLQVDARQTPLSTNRLLVPWANLSARRADAEKALARTDAKGNWLRGRRLFFGEAACHTCHQIRGEGVAFGPELSNLIHRDRNSVLKDILQPSETINPDQAGIAFSMKDGTALNGLLHSTKSGKHLIALPAGATVSVPVDQVLKTEPMKSSLMPEGLLQRLNPEAQEDLLTFLLVNPLEAAVTTRTAPGAPAARTTAEVQHVLGGSPTPLINPKPLRLLLAAGKKDHGLNEHDYPLWLERWAKLLSLGENVTVATSPEGFPKEEQLQAADAVIFYNNNPGWNPRCAALMDAFHQRGGGAVYLHWSINGVADPAGVAERTGLATREAIGFRHGEFDLVFTQPDHPITKGFPTLHFTDETYWGLLPAAKAPLILGTAVENNAPQPEFWTYERGKSRIVGCIPGHYTWTFDDPLFRILVLRSICWTVREENVDRLAELATVGARIR